MAAHLFADQRKAGRCLSMLCLTLLFNAPQSFILSSHRSRPYRCQVQLPCLRLAGGEQPETAEEIVRRAREQELAMLAEEEGTAAGQEGPAVPSCPLATADLLRRAHEQEMSMLANETREEQHSKRVRACENGQGAGDSFKRQKTTFSIHFRHGAQHSAVDTEQLVRSALIEELQMLAEETRAAGADRAGSGGGAISAAPLETGRGQREISERTRRLLLQAHNEEMMMLEREGNAASHASAPDFPREAGWRQGREVADAQGQERGGNGGRAEGRAGSGGHELLARAAVPGLERGGGEEREAASTLILNVSTYVASHGHMPLGKTRGEEGEREGRAGKGGGEQGTEKGKGEEQAEEAEDRCGDEREAGGARGGGGISGSGSGGGGKGTRPPAEPCGLCIGAREGEEEVAQVSWRCETCGEALCDVCVRMHARVKLFAHHVVVPL